MLTLAVVAAAALGAALRFLVDRAVHHVRSWSLPAGTMVVNATGSFGLGLVLGLAAHHGMGTDTSAVLGIGLCGGYTTWSTYCWEMLALARDGAVVEAGVTLAVGLLGGLAAAAAGLALARL